MCHVPLHFTTITGYSVVGAHNKTITPSHTAAAQQPLVTPATVSHEVSIPYCDVLCDLGWTCV